MSSLKINAAALKAASIASKSASEKPVLKFVQVEFFSDGYSITGTDSYQMFYAVTEHEDIPEEIEGLSVLLDANTLYKNLKVSHENVVLLADDHSAIAKDNIENLTSVTVIAYNKKGVAAASFECPIGQEDVEPYPNISPFLEIYKNTTPGTAAIRPGYLNDAARMAQCFGKTTAMSILFSGTEEKDKYRPVFFKYHLQEPNLKAFSLVAPVRV